MLDRLIQYSEKSPVFLHALMWTAYFLATILVNLAFSDNVQLFGILIINLLLVAVFYAWVRIFRWFNVGKYGHGLVMLVLLFTASAGLAYGCLYFFLPGMGVNVANESAAFNTKEFLKNCSIGFYRMGFYAILYMLFLRYRENHRKLVATLNHKLEVEKRNAELERKRRLAQEERDIYRARFLTAQIYPHFLRSNLQGLLVQAVNHGDDAMARTIEYLSEILGYSLKYLRAGKGLVYVRQEIGFLENMIALIRTGAENDGVVHYHETGQDRGALIPPLTLLTFIENVFKYGEVTLLHPLIIKIKHEPERFVFLCENHKKQHPVTAAESGIGLDNLKQRLSLFFKDQFDLEVKQTEENFSVRLTINYSV